jgi:hypothetical protein
MDLTQPLQNQFVRWEMLPTYKLIFRLYLIHRDFYFNTQTPHAQDQTFGVWPKWLDREWSDGSWIDFDITLKFGLDPTQVIQNRLVERGMAPINKLIFRPYLISREILTVIIVRRQHEPLWWMWFPHHPCLYFH